MATLHETAFTTLPGQKNEVERGKVGDVYTLEHRGQELVAVVRTDRISAFDQELPNTIPHKGQVLNQMSAHLLDATKNVAPNWLIDTPDPNVSIGYKATTFKLEMIMRSVLLGSAWKAYRDEDVRRLGDTLLPDNMHEFDEFGRPILTPTTKAESGHDLPITADEIVDLGLATADEFEEMEDLSRKLFAEGQQAALARGLTLADTKYEFGKLADGRIVVIDEVHTPDSSRYFDADRLRAHQWGNANQPEQMSKEFVRKWLKEQGFTGEPGQIAPEMPEDFQQEVSQRYIELYERMTGETFEPAGADMSQGRIRERIFLNIKRSLRNLSI